MRVCAHRAPAYFPMVNHSSPASPPSLPLSFSFSLPLSLSPSLSPSLHFLSLSLSLSHTHTHSPSLPLDTVPLAAMLTCLALCPLPRCLCDMCPVYVASDLELQAYLHAPRRPPLQRQMADLAAACPAKCTLSSLVVPSTTHADGAGGADGQQRTADTFHDCGLVVLKDVFDPAILADLRAFLDSALPLDSADAASQSKYVVSSRDPSPSHRTPSTLTECVKQYGKPLC